MPLLPHLSLRSANRLSLRTSLALALLGMVANSAPIPGTGDRVAEVGDDFEDPSWSYVYEAPKSSMNLDGEGRSPMGYSANGRWEESGWRGQPDVVEVVTTPSGGPAGSTQAMRLRTLESGIPGVYDDTPHQEDFMARVSNRLGARIDTSENLGVVLGLYMPDFSEWEDRTGGTFALRTQVQGHYPNDPDGNVDYWPGIILDFFSSSDPEYDTDSARFRLRAASDGSDFYAGPVVETTGWWTLGMAFSEDGAIHYYVSEGVDDLTAADRVASTNPYTLICDEFDTFYFNVVNLNDGSTWSTPWIIDDAFLTVNNVPEPSTVTLLALLAAAAVRRHRAG